MRKVIFLFSIIMFFFKTSATANYEKKIYDFSIESITGETINFKDYKNKVILIVNTASYCGFTKQYDDLQKIWDTYKNKDFVVIGMPSNQFGSQEPGTNEEIKEFCEVNFNITFPMTAKADVKGDNAHEIYKWAFKNHGKSTIPKWNFHKILINPNGKIEDTFMSFTRPTSKKIINSIENLLN